MLFVNSHMREHEWLSIPSSLLSIKIAPSKRDLGTEYGLFFEDDYNHGVARITNTGSKRGSS